MYRDLVQRLVEEGRAYPCFCSDQELETMKAEAEAAKLPPIYRCGGSGGLRRTGDRLWLCA